MTNTTKPFSAILFFIVYAATGCGHGNPPPSRFPTGQDALDRMKATYACANGSFGEAKLDRMSTQGRIRGTVSALAVNPARVNFQVHSAMHTPVLLLASNGETFQMVDQDKKEFLYGPASACNLARLTKVPLPGHALVSLLRGESPVLVHQAEDLSIRWEGGQYIVDVPSKHRARQRLALEIYEADWHKSWQSQRVRVREMSIEQAGVVLYQATLGDYQLAHTASPLVDDLRLIPTIPPSGGRCDIQVPRVLRIEVPVTGDDVEFTYKEITLNPPLVAGAFALRDPGGLRRIHAVCDELKALRPRPSRPEPLH